jgi:hypothetical protein
MSGCENPETDRTTASDVFTIATPQEPLAW